MKAPTDKANDMIQIQVTTACPIYSCSNCVYAIPFRGQTQHMSLECFREAVRSIADWPGYVCLMGGNPPSHPQFAELCAILSHEVRDQRHRGIVMSDPMRYGDLIRSTFWPKGRMLLNAHGDVTLGRVLSDLFPGRRVNGADGKGAIHSPLLVHYADLGLSDSDWAKAREKCDMNAHWSAGIFERDGKPYAYFCEICGVIDDLLDRNTGIPATLGWWTAKMDGFPDQVEKCCDAGCGIPLAQPGHLDREAIHDVSPTWQKRLEWIRPHGVDVRLQCECEDRVANATDYMRLRS